ncbi:MAG TPA: VTT domain-containing protein [Candidatus Cybelea sp.]|nr:VTT domain-containing protein [Candidatus Cybelea sp.]
MNLPRTAPRIGLAVLLAASIAWAIANRGRFDIGANETVIRGMGAWAPLSYVGLYVIATVLFLPGSFIGVAGGALFGPVWGAIYTLVGATAGATLAFLAARYVASEWVATRAGGRLKQLIEGVEAEGWRFVAFTRLVPLFPFNLLNYALGLTRIGLMPYVIASFICMAPGTIAYTYLGYAGREAFASGEAPVQKGLIALGLLALVGFLPRFVRRLRAGRSGRAAAAGDVSWIEAAELADRLVRRPPPLLIDVRGSDEFNGELGHIAAALNLPVAELPIRLTEIGAHKDKTVILVCRTDKRSTNAATLVRDAGFRDVHVLRGGMERWNQSGLPIEGRSALGHV